MGKRTDPEAARAALSAEERAELLTQVASEWAATFDAIDDLVSVHDGEFRIVRANRALARFLGVAPRDLVGRKCHEVLHGTPEPWPDCPHCGVMESKETVTSEVVDPRIGIPLLVTCSPFFDGSGTLRGTVHVARDISSQKRADEERERLIAELQEALSTVHLLSGIIPICSACKKIRDVEGEWVQLEHYISSRSEANFTHGICPECADRLYPGLGRRR